MNTTEYRDPTVSAHSIPGRPCSWPRRNWAMREMLRRSQETPPVQGPLRRVWAMLAHYSQYLVIQMMTVFEGVRAKLEKGK